MGFWEDLSNAVDAVAQVVQDVVETVGDAAADVVETAGNAAQGWLEQFGGPTAWLGGVISGITNVAGAVIKAVSGIISGIVGGAIRIIGGIILLNENLFIKGLMDIFTSIGGAFIYLVGTLFALIEKILSSSLVEKALALLGITVSVQRQERELTKAERDMLERIFLNSISLENVRLVEGGTPIFGSGTYATTLGNTIYMRDIVPDTYGGRSTLAHECVHVWQYQNIGSRYTAEALLPQYSWPEVNGAKPGYNWEVVEVNRGNTEWKDFNREAQAEFIQDVWRIGSSTINGHTRQDRGAFFDANLESSITNDSVEFVYIGSTDSQNASVGNSTIPMDYTDIAIEAVRFLRGRINLRLSKSIWSGN